MKASRTTFLFSAFVATCLAAAHCSGDDSNSTPPGVTAGTNNNGASGDSSGASGSVDTTGASGNNSGTSGSTGNAGANGTGGANGNAGSNGNAGTNGAGGGAAGGGNTNNNPACPAAAPMDATMCSEGPDAGRFGLVCNYTSPGMTTSCDCAQGGRLRDGGRAPSEWNCTTRAVRDAGAPRDGGGFPGFDAATMACPQGTMDNGTCTMNAEYCNNGQQNCICFGTNANNRRWNCF